VLILALLIVVLVTALVVATSWRFELAMSRNENRWHGAQGRLVLEGGERLVSKLLLLQDLDDPTDDGRADHLNEAWNAPQTVPIDGGAITVEVTDALARFNLNLLALPKLALNPTTPEGQLCQKDPMLFSCEFTVAQRRFIRFLQTITLNDENLTPEEATAITQAIIDWLDPDDNVTGFGGAEQSFYSGSEVPLVVSNAPMTTVSELSLVKGITAEIYEKLLPYIVALPADGDNAAYININTMPTIMFRMFNSKDINIPLELEQGDQLAQLRNEKAVFPEQGYQDPNQFVSSAIVTEIQVVTNANDFDSTQLVTSSNYFIYSAEVVVGDKTRRGKSLLRRLNGKVETLWRTDANF
jgi:general secretion pathway protein K